VLAALVIAPLLLAGLILALPGARRTAWLRVGRRSSQVPEQARAWLVPAGAAFHAGLTAGALAWPPAPGLGGWLVLDPLARLVLGFLSVLFLLCSLYVPGYLRLRPVPHSRVFCAALLAFLGMMTLIVLSHHLGLMWVAMEAGTLVAAPLVYFDRNPRSLEATWKYLLIGSVGIALALLGSFFLAYSALHGGLGPSLLFEDLVRDAPHLSRPWLHAAFVLLLVGYGTKMGLAPMHTWKPDAYGEAPGLVGALLAGGLTQCAFLAVLRFVQICTAAGEAAFAREILLFLGLLSMAVAGVFLVRQRDYKRMLAYSSVEHVGILAVGVGLGGAGTWGALLHLLNNGFCKGVLFLSAANLHRAYGSKLTDDVSGVLRTLPATGALFLGGFFAVTGSPPFGPFISELTILRAAVAGERPGVAALFLVLVMVVFLGMGATVIRVVQGPPAPRPPTSTFRESLGTVAPAAGLLLLVLLLGLWLPAPLRTLLDEAAAFIEVRP
jgi:hydrogenase-4 component F